MHQERHALPVRPTPCGVDIDVSELRQDQDVVVNFLWRPGIRVFADGTPLLSRADLHQRVQVGVEAGKKTLVVRYESPWSKGIGLGMLLLAGGIFGRGVLDLPSPPLGATPSSVFSSLCRKRCFWTASETL